MKTGTFLAGGACGFAVLLGFSCTPEKSGGEGPGPIQIEQLKAEFESANCDFRVRCTFFPDAASCKSASGADYKLLQLIADVSLGKVTYDPAAARGWVEILRGQRCALRSTAAIDALRAAWEPVFVGTIAKGESCFVDDECTGELVCDKSACGDGENCCAGSCAKKPAPKKVGELCGTDGVPCEDTAYCGDPMPMAQATECIPRVQNGEVCATEFACQDDQWCIDKCYKLAAPGQQCNPALPYACNEYNNWCDPEKSVCSPLPAAGEPCGANGCAIYAYCDGGTCRMRPGGGEACAGDGPACLGDLMCNDGTCARGSEQVCTN